MDNVWALMNDLVSLRDIVAEHYLLVHKSPFNLAIPSPDGTIESPYIHAIIDVIDEPHQELDLYTIPIVASRGETNPDENTLYCLASQDPSILIDNNNNQSSHPLYGMSVENIMERQPNNESPLLHYLSQVKEIRDYRMSHTQS